MYSKQIKFDILTTIGFITGKNCYKSFLVGLCKGSRYKSYVKAQGKLAKAVIEAIKGIDDIKANDLSFPVSVKYYKKKLHIRGIDMLKLRKHFVQSFVYNDKKKYARAFLQGMFISCGYVQNPETAYHLEFKIKEKWKKIAFVKCSKRLKIKFSNLSYHTY